VLVRASGVLKGDELAAARQRQDQFRILVFDIADLVIDFPDLQRIASLGGPRWLQSSNARTASVAFKRE
jgi:hypothetical protein